MHRSEAAPIRQGAIGESQASGSQSVELMVRALKVRLGHQCRY
jgi:hypothetical protein